MSQPIFKIVERKEWQAARPSGVYHGAAVDLSDGFIHFSTAEQVAETARRHFAGQRDLLLVAVDPDALGPKLRYELSRGGALFPHLYAVLPFSAVLWEKPLPEMPDGGHDFSGLLT
ncbi:DUF952 domain-containing protein [Martelella radicis]|uniref:Uncharacterized protein (DUF952 family) n=1 Tax=Martelella radicis TaxID=1397476 RepID=A0A7W6KKZ9_9HYPH|nr:DUF952 domain-containing protein [Martelella radicis]MBB4123163.1 uncharacterized protein (DUF952 family) [Martelella radicis]